MSALPETRRPVVAIVGNPNTGKSTLFNALTGLSQKVGNYPGVTVERKSGRLRETDLEIEVVDLPGTYSLAARSLDEAIAVDAILGRIRELGEISVVVVVVDAAVPERNLLLASQVLELGRPVVVALNMIDVAEARGIAIDPQALSRQLGVPVVALRADRRIGLQELRAVLVRLIEGPVPAPPPVPYPESFSATLHELHASLPPGGQVSRPELIRALVDEGGVAEARLRGRLPASGFAALPAARRAAGGGRRLAAVEAEARMTWARNALAPAVRRTPTAGPSPTARLDAVLTHRLLGMGILLLALGVVFQAIYAWSTPVMDLIDAAFAALGSAVGQLVPPGMLESLLVDGIIAAVGGVVVFLPQILLLALIFAVLEDCGYMARVAFLSDRILGWLGLSGRAALPLLSGCACAVPAIMAARTIENRRERLATILVTPLMSCSARLPVYVLMIGAFVPERMLVGGWVSLRGLCLLGAHLLGVIVAVPVLLFLKKALLRGPAIPFVMELPAYRWPSWLAILDRLQIQARAFLLRAGTVIAAVGIVVWALAYFPRPAAIHETYEAWRSVAVDEASRAQLDREEAAAYLQQSVLGRLGQAIEPAVAPLGWDWRIGMGAIASFPAREVVVATLATVFGVGESDEEAPGGIRGAIDSATRADGTPLFTAAVGLSLVVFFALCCQCAATLAVIRRETGSWAWAAFVFLYMTALAYLGAWIAYRLGSLLFG